MSGPVIGVGGCWSVGGQCRYNRSNKKSVCLIMLVSWMVIDGGACLGHFLSSEFVLTARLMSCTISHQITERWALLINKPEDFNTACTGCSFIIPEFKNALIKGCPS